MRKALSNRDLLMIALNLLETYQESTALVLESIGYQKRIYLLIGNRLFRVAMYTGNIQPIEVVQTEGKPTLGEIVTIRTKRYTIRARIIHKIYIPPELWNSERELAI